MSITKADVDEARRNASFYEAAAMRAQARGNFERAAEFKRDAKRHGEFADRVAPVIAEERGPK